MAKIEFHPIAGIFPLVQGEEFDALVASIKTKGLLNPIWLHPDGRVIDGRNRYNACLKARVEQKFRTWNRKGSLLDFVIAQNLERRHLDASDRALLAVRLKPLYAEEAKERQQEGGIKGGKTKPLQQDKVPEKISEASRSKSEGEARERAAKAAHSNSNYVQTVERLKEEAPDLFSKIESKDMTVVQASRAARERKREARRAENRKKAARAAKPQELVGKAHFATIVIDPPWDVSDEGDVNQMGRANPDYATMPINEIRKLPVGELADTDCHLYLWVTNRSLPKAFPLLEAWGFRYITMLTWCKPSFGIGNYFRGSTEHLIFGVKGSQPLKRKDVGTWFEAPRGRGHSAKPEQAYALIESCSPGPYLEMFSRSQRPGWKHWGEEA